MITTEDRYATAANANNLGAMRLQLATADVYLGALATSETEGNAGFATVRSALTSIGITNIGVPFAPPVSTNAAQAQASALTVGQLADLLGALKAQLPGPLSDALAADLAQAQAATFVQTQAAALSQFETDALAAGDPAGDFLALAAGEAANP